jgi:hypothetical protein
MQKNDIIKRVSLAMSPDANTMIRAVFGHPASTNATARYFVAYISTFTIVDGEN